MNKYSSKLLARCLVYLITPNSVLVNATTGTSLVLAACGDNQLKQQAPTSPVEEAQLLLEAGDYLAARSTLESYLEEFPEDHQARGLLAASYAFEAGISIFQITDAAFNSQSEPATQNASQEESSSGNTDKSSREKDSIEKILPAATEANIAAVKRARTIILAIPAEGRDKDIAFAETIYVSAYALLLLKKLSTQEAPPTFDEAQDMITSIDAAVELAAQNNVPTEKVRKIKEDIDREPGSTEQEKVTSFLTKLKAKEGRAAQSAAPQSLPAAAQ